MNAEMRDAIVQLINNQVNRQTIILAIIGIIAAAVSAYFGNYLKKKADNFATREDFRVTLDQLKIQTTEIESIRSDLLVKSNIQLEEIKKSHSTELEHIRDEITSVREAITTRRTMITDNLNSIVTACIEAVAIGWTARYPKLRLDPAARKQSAERLRLLCTEIELRVQILFKIGAIDEHSYKRFSGTELLVMRFNGVMGELDRGVPELLAHIEDGKPYEERRVVNANKELDEAIISLKNSVLEVIPKIELPK